MSGDFVDKSNWGNILRGYIYNAAMFYPSDTKRPLEFFIPNGNNPKNGYLVNHIGDFKAKLIDGKHRAIEQKVVVTLKPRKVIVITNDEINHNTDFEYIHVAPIMSIHLDDKTKAWYQKVIKDEHPLFVYLPKEITNMEAYVDISEVMSVHKSLLLQKQGKVPADRLQIIEQTIMECLDLGLYEEEELHEKTVK